MSRIRMPSVLARQRELVGEHKGLRLNTGDGNDEKHQPSFSNGSSLANQTVHAHLAQRYFLLKPAQENMLARALECTSRAA